MLRISRPIALLLSVALVSVGLVLGLTLHLATASSELDRIHQVIPRCSSLVDVSNDVDLEVKEERKGALPSVPIYVVDEHHEALPYWRRVCGNRGVKHAVLHFDAHPDDGIPHKVQQPEQLGMTSNDEFIFAAAYAGFVNRFIWVFPSWDQRGPRHKQAFIHGQLSIARLGYLLDGTPCACQTRSVPLDSEAASQPKGWEALANESKELGDSSCIEGDDQPVLAAQCNITVDLPCIFINEGDISKVETWWPSLLGDDVILDIDEDHFAQSIITDRLMPVVQKLDAQVASFSCHQQGGVSEEQVSTAVRSLINHILNGTTPSLPAALAAAACNNTGQAFEALLLKLQALSTLDLRLLRIYSVCFSTSPLTVGETQILKVCTEGVGSDTARRNIDTDTHPSEIALAEEPLEIDVRLLEFRSAIYFLAPHLVGKTRLATLCRSVRDGYTPRRSWHTIESEVLATLGGKASFDSNLLGGPGGWKSWTHLCLQHSALIA